MAEWPPQFYIGILAVNLHRVSVLALLALAGCAPAFVPWASTRIPQDQWSHDWSNCRRQAEDSVMGYGREDDTKTPFDAYDRANARRQADGMVASCMINLGYVPARKGN